MSPSRLREAFAAIWIRVRHQPDFRTYLTLYAIGFLLYLIAWLVCGYLEAGDTGMYMQMGQGVFEHFTFGYLGTDHIYYANAFRMPLIPTFLGLLRAITGSNHGAYTLYSLWQVAIAPILPCAAFYFGLKVNRISAYASYILILISGNLIWCTLSILTDVPFAIASFVCYVALWKLGEQQTVCSARRFGICIGISCLIRPIAKFYFLLVAAWLVVAKCPPRLLLKLLGWSALMLVIIMTPWVIRNFFVYKTFVIETNQGVNMIWSTGQLTKIKPTDDPERKRIKSHILHHPENPMEYISYNGFHYWVTHDLVVSKVMQSIASEVYRDRPGDVLKIWWTNTKNLISYQSMHKLLFEHFATTTTYKRLRSLWGSPGTFDIEYRDFTSWWMNTLTHLYAVWAWIGLVILFFWRRRLALFILLQLLYFTGLTAFVAGSDRYRLNIDIFYAVLITCPLSAAIVYGLSARQRFQESRAHLSTAQRAPVTVTNTSRRGSKKKSRKRGRP